jgi:hypothetical protein
MELLNSKTMYSIVWGLFLAYIVVESSRNDCISVRADPNLDGYNAKYVPCPLDGIYV